MLSKSGYVEKTKKDSKPIEARIIPDRVDFCKKSYTRRELIPFGSILIYWNG